MATNFATGTAQHKDGYLSGKAAAEQAMGKLGGKHPHLALLFLTGKYPFTEVSEGIKSIIGSVPVVGCTTAGAFTEDTIVEDGVTLALIASDTHHFFPSLGCKLAKDQIKTIKSATQNIPKKIEGFPYRSALLFLDGLIGKGEETALAASSILGPLVKLAGAAASDRLEFKQTEVFGDGMSKNDSLSLCYMASRTPVALGVKHCHKPMSPSLRVTKAKDNIVYEIEGKPAFSVWKEYIPELDKEPHALLRYQAGLLIGNDYKVRFPLSVNPDQSLNFGCSIFEGSAMKIMHSQQSDQLSCMKKAAEIALENANGVPIAGAIVFNCACKKLLLHSEEVYLATIQELKKNLKGVPIIGLESYGEIALEAGQMSGFHNASTVVLLIPQ